ncbi:MAG: MBL fold metallo-hydrolase [Terracidiphilus sp.]
MGTLHFLDVGCADASVIISDTATYLVDCQNIGDYPHVLPENKRIRGVFMTHQHSDHYSGLDFLRKNGYAIDFLIYSPYERRYNDASVTIDEWNEFNDYRDYFVGRGTELRTPFKQEEPPGPWKKPFWPAEEGVKFWMLGPEVGIARSQTRELHDACLVIRADLGARICTFTGDASDANLGAVAAGIDNICGDLLHASHHGSLQGADLGFIKKCNAKYTVISTASGEHENVPHPTALQRYRENSSRQVWRTDVDGSGHITF